jgi:triosephosphate isomerase
VSRVPARGLLVAGNWKMNKTGDEAVEHCGRLLPLLPASPLAQVAVCPPLTALERVARALDGSAVWTLAQTVHEAPKGAHTGEVSVPMIAAAGALGSIVGHSERRAAGETDIQVAARARALIDADLLALVCVGESLEQREQGQTIDWLTAQVRAALALVQPGEERRLAVAYEPIWAIGTGRTATPDTAQEACAHVRLIIGESLDPDAVRVLYGGSVTPENADELMAQPDVDGALVGGASLDPDGFAAVVAAAG